MNKYWFFIALLAIGNLLCAQQNSEKYILIKKNSGWGIVNNTGKEITHFNYPEARVHHSSILLWKGNQFHSYAPGEKPQIWPVGATDFEQFHKNKYILHKRKHLFITDSAGNLLFQDTFIFIQRTAYQDYYIFGKEGKTGIIDSSGNILLAFDKTVPIIGNHSCAYYNQNSMFYIYSLKEKKQIYKDSFSQVVWYPDFLLGKYKSNRQIILSLTGDILFKSDKPIFVNDFGNGFYFLDIKTRNQKLNRILFDATENKKIELDFDQIYSCEMAHSFIYKKNNQYRFYTRGKPERSELIFSEIELETAPYIVKDTIGRVGLLDTSFEFLLPIQYFSIVRINEDIFAISEILDFHALFNKNNKKFATDFIYRNWVIGAGYIKAYQKEQPTLDVYDIENGEITSKSQYKNVRTYYANTRSIGISNLNNRGNNTNNNARNRSNIIESDTIVIWKAIEKMKSKKYGLFKVNKSTQKIYDTLVAPTYNSVIAANSITIAIKQEKVVKEKKTYYYPKYDFYFLNNTLPSFTFKNYENNYAIQRGLPCIVQDSLNLYYLFYPTIMKLSPAKYSIQQLNYNYYLIKDDLNSNPYIADELLNPMKINKKLINAPIHSVYFTNENFSFISLKDSVYGAIDTLGNILIPFEYTAYSYSNKTVNCYKPVNQKLYYTATGSLLNNAAYDKITNLNEILVLEKDTQKYIYSNGKSKTIDRSIHPKKFKNNKGIYIKKGKYYICNSALELLNPLPLEFAAPFNNLGKSIIKVKNKFFLIDTFLQPVAELKGFERVSELFDYFAIVFVNNKSHFMNLNGKIIPNIAGSVPFQAISQKMLIYKVSNSSGAYYIFSDELGKPIYTTKITSKPYSIVGDYIIANGKDTVILNVHTAKKIIAPRGYSVEMIEKQILDPSINQLSEGNNYLYLNYNKSVKLVHSINANYKPYFIPMIPSAAFHNYFLSNWGMYPVELNNTNNIHNASSTKILRNVTNITSNDSNGFIFSIGKQKGYFTKNQAMLLPPVYANLRTNGNQGFIVHVAEKFDVYTTTGKRVLEDQLFQQNQGDYTVFYTLQSAVVYNPVNNQIVYKEKK